MSRGLVCAAHLCLLLGAGGCVRYSEESGAAWQGNDGPVRDAPVHPGDADQGGGRDAVQPEAAGDLDGSLACGASAGLVAHWAFDEMAGTTASDSAGKGYTGRLYNMDAASAWVPGQIGGAVAFDGVDDYVDVAKRMVLGPTRSVSLWFRSPDVSHNSAMRLFLIREAGEDTGSAFGVDISGAETPAPSIRGLIEAGSHWGSYFTRGSTALRNDTWYHVVFIVDHTALSLYLDGALEASSTAKAVGEVDNPVLIGKGICCSRELVGVIDEVRVYDRVLGAQEVRELYGCAAQRTNETGAP